MGRTMSIESEGVRCIKGYSAQVRTGGHTGPPLRWKLPPRRAVHPKRSRPSLRNEKKLRILLAYELRKQRATRHALIQRVTRLVVV